MRASAGRRALPAVLFVLIAGGAGDGDAYRFLTIEEAPTAFPTVVPASAWDPEVWGPGETLRFTLLESAEWFSLSRSIQEVEQLLEEAMRAWESVPTADVRWTIGDTAPDEPHTFRQDSFIRARDRNSSTTYVQWDRAEDGLWYATRAWIAMGAYHLSDPNRFREAVLHEFGHVIGLDHASVYAGHARPAHLADGLLASHWRFDPILSYGNTGEGQRREYADMLTPDDRIGASLARPRDDWLASTGNIRGQVVLEDGGAAGTVHVLASRLLEDGTMAGSVGAFANARGEFVIGGLEPGRYALLVRPLKIHRAHLDLIPWATTWIRDTLWGPPVTVTAGERARFVTIVVAPGEESPGSR